MYFKLERAISNEEKIKRLNQEYLEVVDQLMIPTKYKQRMPKALPLEAEFTRVPK